MKAQNSADQDYNPHLSIPDVAKMMTPQTGLDQIAMEIHQPVIRKYGEMDEQDLLIFPTSPTAPVHLFFHGGFWRIG